MKGKHFRCDCNWAMHSLYIEPDCGCDNIYASVQVVNAPADVNLRQRIKMAWAILRGNEHAMTEVWIHRDDWQEFVDYIVNVDKERQPCNHASLGEANPGIPVRCPKCGKSVISLWAMDVEGEA